MANKELTETNKKCKNTDSHNMNVKKNSVMGPQVRIMAAFYGIGNRCKSNRN